MAACGADPEPWTAAHARVRHGRGQQPSAEAPASGDPGADVSVRLAPWVKFYDRSPYAEALLRRVPRAPKPDETAGDLTELPALLGRLTNSLVTVEAVTPYRGVTLPVDSPERFWALVGAAVVLRRFEGSRMWLLQETEEIARGNNPRHLRQLRSVWEALFDLLLRADTLEQCAWPPRQVVEDVDRATNSRPRRIRLIMDWLFEVFPAEHVVGSGLRRAAAGKFPGLPVTASRAFAPPLVSIDPVFVPTRQGGRSYSFEAMRYPLTVGDMQVLWRNRVGTARPSDLRLPYVLGGHADERGTGPGRFLQELVRRCLLTSDDDDLGGERVWAVPTAPEWLALAGCAEDGRPYPWGTTPPTPEHANLRFPDRPQRAQTVDSHGAGMSDDGVWDCCGNVHEVVEWQLGGMEREAPTPADFRLAGASFRNRPENASCRAFRLFALEPEPRHNVGVRLVRYRAEDAGLRKDALRRFHQRRSAGRGRA
ncbi:hypothetical protein [Streptomyces sp. H51]|uniref:hypothetical protein n=1 Tax=Streptomyces sp. H51 TaxID=3111770 RepID=UPI002D772F2B|nr:hypothetical protein [Streptomyces sp. H51]